MTFVLNVTILPHNLKIACHHTPTPNKIVGLEMTLISKMKHITFSPLFCKCFIYSWVTFGIFCRLRSKGQLSKFYCWSSLYGTGLSFLKPVSGWQCCHLSSDLVTDRKHSISFSANIWDLVKSVRVTEIKERGWELAGTACLIQFCQWMDLERTTATSAPQFPSKHNIRHRLSRRFLVVHSIHSLFI